MDTKPKTHKKSAPSISINNNLKITAPPPKESETPKDKKKKDKDNKEKAKEEEFNKIKKKNSGFFSNLKIKKSQFKSDKDFNIKKAKTKIDPFYKDEKSYKKKLADYKRDIYNLQNMLFAHNKYSILIVFQAMDAAGKDSTIAQSMKGINPNGVSVKSFKKPTEEELNHDFLWRHSVNLPERGSITIFNRSYYEEVIVTKVHPEIITKYQKLPQKFNKESDFDELFEKRYQDINNYEQMLKNNGFVIIKFFLHVSKKEQKKRFLDRLNIPEKNYKFTESDIKERAFWKKYMKAYEKCIQKTSDVFPWHVIPADDKKNMRTIVCEVILKHLRKLDISYPVIDEDIKKKFDTFRKILENEDDSDDSKN